MKNRVRAALAAVALLVALTGCVKVDADLEVHSNETVSGKMQLGIDKQLIQASRQSLDQVRRQIESGIKQSSTQGVACEPFEDDRFVGSNCELDDVPFAEMGSSSGQGVNFRKDGDQFVVTVNAGSLNSFPQPAAAGQPEVDFKITMPGKIISHDQGASVSGRTATYDSLEELGSVSLRSESGGGFPLLALVLVVLLLLAAIAAVVYFLRRGRKRGPQHPGQYQGQYPQGQAPEGRTPQDQWGPQYGAQPGEQPMQYGQPGQPMQYGQPNQPMQYGQPGPGQHPGQYPGQPNQPMQYGPPGQYPGQPTAPQGQPGLPGQWGPPGQQPDQPGQWGPPNQQPGQQPGQQPARPADGTPPGGWPEPPSQGRQDPDQPPGPDETGRPSAGQ